MDGVFIRVLGDDFFLYVHHTNVIALFGRDEFEELRRKHKIEFKELDGFSPSVI